MRTTCKSKHTIQIIHTIRSYCTIHGPERVYDEVNVKRRGCGHGGPLCVCVVAGRRVFIAVFLVTTLVAAGHHHHGHPASLQCLLLLSCVMWQGGEMCHCVTPVHPVSSGHPYLPAHYTQALKHCCPPNLHCHIWNQLKQSQYKT